MVKYRILIVLITILLFSYCCSSTSNCKSKEELIKESIEAINHRNMNEYVSLIDFDGLLKIWKEASDKDKEYKEFVDLLKKDKKELIKAYSISYLMVINTIKKIHKLENFHFEIIEFGTT